MYIREEELKSIQQIRTNFMHDAAFGMKLEGTSCSVHGKRKIQITEAGGWWSHSENRKVAGPAKGRNRSHVKLPLEASASTVIHLTTALRIMCQPPKDLPPSHIS